jgi:3',5'-cyclic AMP phosphodiesterase CpdA
MSSATRIAFLSDIHLGPLPPFGWAHWNIKRGLGYANWQRKRRLIHDRDAVEVIVEHILAQEPSHIIVGGDLINIGLPAEYEAALKWLLALGGPDFVTVVPGNHDIYTRLLTDPGPLRWQAYMTGEDRWQPSVRRGTGLRFPFLRTIGDVAIIGLNSAHPTAPLSARGRLGQQQLADLADVLHQTEVQGLFRLVAVHHPPLRGLAPFRRALADAGRFEGQLAAYGAELVVHGHNHRIETNAAAGPNGPIPVLGTGSASSVVTHRGEPLASYRLFDISGSAASGWQLRSRVFGLAPNTPEVIAIEDTALPQQRRPAHSEPES